MNGLIGGDFLDPSSAWLKSVAVSEPMEVTIVLDAEHLVAPRFLNGSGDASHFLHCCLQVNAGGAHRLGARSGFCGVATDVTRTHVSCGGQRRRWGHLPGSGVDRSIPWPNE